MGDTVEKIEDPEELAQVRKQAKKVQIKSLIAGVLMTLLVLFVP